MKKKTINEDNMFLTEREQKVKETTTRLILNGALKCSRKRKRKRK